MWNYGDTTHQVKQVTQDDFDDKVFTSEEVEFDFAFIFAKVDNNEKSPWPVYYNLEEMKDYLEVHVNQSSQIVEESYQIEYK